jgi:hypothetical protein
LLLLALVRLAARVVEAMQIWRFLVAQRRRFGLVWLSWSLLLQARGRSAQISRLFRASMPNFCLLRLPQQQAAAASRCFNEQGTCIIGSSCAAGPSSHSRCSGLTAPSLCCQPLQTLQSHQCC